MTALGERLKDRLAEPSLDWGICHMDLTLDNVHVAEGLTVFDFDSAGACWRAVEPYGVLRFSEPYFRAWLAGYRSVRPFGDRRRDGGGGVRHRRPIFGWWRGSSEWPHPRAATRCSPPGPSRASSTAGLTGKRFS